MGHPVDRTAPVDDRGCISYRTRPAKQFQDNSGCGFVNVCEDWLRLPVWLSPTVEVRLAFGGRGHQRRIPYRVAPGGQPGAVVPT